MECHPEKKWKWLRGEINEAVLQLEGDKNLDFCFSKLLCLHNSKQNNKNKKPTSVYLLKNNYPTQTRWLATSEVAEHLWKIIRCHFLLKRCMLFTVKLLSHLLLPWYLVHLISQEKIRKIKEGGNPYICLKSLCLRAASFRRQEYCSMRTWKRSIFRFNFANYKDQVVCIVKGLETWRVAGSLSR